MTTCVIVGVQYSEQGSTKLRGGGHSNYFWWGHAAWFLQKIPWVYRNLEPETNKKKILWFTYISNLGWNIWLSEWQDAEEKPAPEDRPGVDFKQDECSNW